MINVTSIELQVIGPPTGKRLRILFDMAEAPRVPHACKMAIVGIDSKFEAS